LLISSKEIKKKINKFRGKKAQKIDQQKKQSVKLNLKQAVIMVHDLWSFEDAGGTRANAF
jgi:hypothetical protein